MHIELQNDGDTWYGVTDAKKRKQIQNRLAQRQRRKRLADAQVRDQDDFSTPQSKGDTSVFTSPSVSDTRRVGRQMPKPALEPYSTHPLDHQYLTRPVSTVFGAMFNNGRILGLTCGIQVPRLSPPCTDEVPLSLHPTMTQMTVLHVPWIDRFPFPKMRDNAIRLSGTYYEEEFLDDLFTGDAFHILPGSFSWDPEGWKITSSFLAKWAFLFD